LTIRKKVIIMNSVNKITVLRGRVIFGRQPERFPTDGDVRTADQRASEQVRDRPMAVDLVRIQNRQYSLDERR
jgi:hypothetical protein